jgi:hypothetical protein
MKCDTVNNNKSYLEAAWGLGGDKRWLRGGVKVVINTELL